MKYIAMRQDGRIFIISEEEAQKARRNVNSDWHSWQTYFGKLPIGAEFEVKNFSDSIDAFVIDIPSDWVLLNLAKNLLNIDYADVELHAKDIEDLANDLAPLLDRWGWTA